MHPAHEQNLLADLIRNRAYGGPMADHVLTTARLLLDRIRAGEPMPNVDQSPSLAIVIEVCSMIADDRVLLAAIANVAQSRMDVGGEAARQ